MNGVVLLLRADQGAQRRVWVVDKLAVRLEVAGRASVVKARRQIVGFGSFDASFGFVKNFKLTVASAATFAPAILTQPSGSGTVLAGLPLTFGAYVTYHWQIKSNDISEATLSQDTIANPTVADSGYYRLVVTNALGNAASTNVFISESRRQRQQLHRIEHADRSDVVTALVDRGVKLK